MRNLHLTLNDFNLEFSGSYLFIITIIIMKI